MIVSSHFIYIYIITKIQNFFQFIYEYVKSIIKFQILGNQKHIFGKHSLNFSYAFYDHNGTSSSPENLVQPRQQRIPAYPWRQCCQLYEDKLPVKSGLGTAKAHPLQSHCGIDMCTYEATSSRAFLLYARPNGTHITHKAMNKFICVYI